MTTPHHSNRASTWEDILLAHTHPTANALPLSLETIRSGNNGLQHRFQRNFVDPYSFRDVPTLRVDAALSPVRYVSYHHDRAFNRDRLRSEATHFQACIARCEDAVDNTDALGRRLLLWGWLWDVAFEKRNDIFQYWVPQAVISVYDLPTDAGKVGRHVATWGCLNLRRDVDDDVRERVRGMGGYTRFTAEHCAALFSRVPQLEGALDDLWTYLWATCTFLQPFEEAKK